MDAIWMRFPHVSSSTAVTTGPISSGSWVNRTPRATSGACSARASSTPNEVYGMPSAASASLNTRAAGCASSSFSSPTRTRTDDGQPAVVAHRDLGLLHEAEHVGVEAQRLVLVVDQDAGDSDPWHEVLTSGWATAGRSRRAMWCRADGTCSGPHGAAKQARRPPARPGAGRSPAGWRSGRASW